MVRISRIEDYLELRHSDYRGIKLFSGHYRVRNRNRYAAGHEPDLVTFLELLPEGAVFWDVGANVGFFSIFAARRGILSLAFEPDQLTCGVLNKNIYLNAVSESCVALPIALNDERMIDVLNMKEFLPANAYNTFGRDKNERGAEFVPTFKQGAVGIPADELPLGPGLAKFAQPDFVKIDVDGNELKVIRGMRGLLKKTSFLCVELADDHPEMPDTRDEIASLGFEPMDDPRIVDRARLGNTIRNHYFRNASGTCSLRSQGDPAFRSGIGPDTGRLMKAIVLTYDRNQHVAHHMVARYRKLWPDHPFSFRIPYQSLISIPEGFAVSYVRTEPPIVDTVRTLLAEIADEEWIFWSIDDYFPIRLDLPWIRRLIDRLHDPEASDVSGFNFCASYKKKRYWRNGQLRQKRHVRLFGERFVEVPDYDQMWFPQFFRGRVLKTFFGQLENPRDHAKELDYQLRRLTKPAGDRLLMSSSDHAIFAESTIRSGYTHDFVESATEMGIPFDRTRAATETSQWKRSGRMGLGDRWEKFLGK